MDDAWQCGDCATIIEGPDTRKCPNCGGINFFPLADDVPGDGPDNDEETVGVEAAIDRLPTDDE